MQSISPESIPEAVQAAYGIRPDTQVEELAGGLINTTYKITNENSSAILQKLAETFDERAIADQVATTAYMASRYWDAPTTLPTRGGAMHVADEQGRLWRSLEYITSDVQPPAQPSGALSESIGALLGSWHRDIADYAYKPQLDMSAIHDTNQQRTKLEAYLAQLTGTMADIANQVLTQTSALPHVGSYRSQLIHGDPKMANILFRDGYPHTLIDYDTVMPGQIWTDIGDALRSTLGKLPATESVGDYIRQFMAGYADAYELDQSLDHVEWQARIATARVAGTLSMRYLCDIVDDNYFAWDQNTYTSRAENHRTRALAQLAVAQTALEGVS